MSKGVTYFLVFIIFIVGISFGMYFSNSINDEPVKNQAKINDSIQDIVIKQVQAENEEKYNDVQEVVAQEKKISPYAKLIIEKFFTECKHTTVDIISIPKELINLTESEFAKKYDKWVIKKFEPEEISIYREIDANCSDHFVVKEKEGYIAVYNELSKDILELKEITNIELDSLREEDKIAIEAGISLYGKNELSSFIEDFDS